METIQQQIDIWDKWGYDTENESFVFFTLHDEWEDENCFYCRFKAKAWLKGKFSDFILALKNEENQKTFTSNTETYTIKCLKDAMDEIKDEIEEALEEKET